MERPAVFSRTERTRVRRQAARAEELTGSFYCIPGREWPRFPVEIRTLDEGPAPDPGAFAEVVRLVPEIPSPGLRELWRIVLRDDRILAAVREGGEAIRLDPLLLYVLTHEFVHVVRFGTGAAPFDASGQARLDEERRVHAITREILRREPDPALDRVIEAYRDALLEAPRATSSSSK